MDLWNSGAFVCRLALVVSLLGVAAPARASGPSDRCGYAPDPLEAMEGAVRAGVASSCEEIQRCFFEKRRRILSGGKRRMPVEVPARPLRLRSTGKALPVSECREIADRFNFAANGEGHGCFVNAFLKDGETVKDLATGLAWAARLTPDLDRAGAARHVAQLNRKRFGGASGWRLPTLEELLSIAEALHPRTMREQGALEWPRLDLSLFDAGEQEGTEPRPVWTSDWEGDREGSDRVLLTVDFQWARCWSFPGDGKWPYPVRAVRTLSQEEYERARAAFSSGR